MTVKTDLFQAGFDALASRNFTLDTDVAGALRLRRGNAGATPVSTPLVIDKNDNLLLLQRGGVMAGHSSYADGPAKNLLMNPSGTINQRALGAVNVHNTYYCDRWRFDSSIAANLNMQAAGWIDAGGNYGAHLAQVVTQKPALAVGDYSVIMQQIEGLYMRDVAWGSGQSTPYQQPMTFSCWAYCGVAHTFCLALRQAGLTSFVHPFTIPAATWTYCSCLIPAPTIGTFPTDNSSALSVAIALFAASNGTFTTPNADVWQAGNYLAHSSIGNYLSYPVNTQFAISAPQLEVGSVASKFARPDFQTELLRCQRYYESSYPYGMNSTNTGGATADGISRMLALDSNTLMTVGNSLCKVAKRTVGSFTVYQSFTGVAHNARKTVDGSSAALSNYNAIGVWGPNVISAVGTLAANAWYDVAWTYNADF